MFLLMSENNSYPILNPDVYLNYLQPTVADEYEIARNVFLVTLGALLWDILSTLPNDWKIFRTTKISPVLLAYFLSRTCALAVVLMSALGQTGPVQECGVVALVTCIFLVFASGSSSYLFLKRVHAVFFQERRICHAFTVLWVAEVGTSTAVLPGPLHDFYQIAHTKHCTNVKIKGYVSAAFIAPLLFDALVFCAVSYKILMLHRPAKPMNRKAICFAGALPRLSKAILQGGQQYYMITTGVNVTRTILALLPNISPILQLVPSVPAVALTCAMACRVFRNLKLEAMQKTEVRMLTTVQFANRELVDAHSSKHLALAEAEAGLAQG